MLNRDSLLLFGLKDIRDRHLRLIGALEELSRVADIGELRFLEAVIQTVKNRLRTYDSRVIDALDPIILTQDDLEFLNAARANLATLAKDGFNGYAKVLLEAFPHLPLNRRPSADVGFYLARAYNMSPTRQTHRSKFALNHGRYTVWESRAFSTEHAAVATIPVPFGEALTPLRWPLFVHELAHWYKPGGEPIHDESHARLKEEFATEELPVAIVEAFEEVFSDLAALRACGPSYVLALAKEAQLAPSQHHGRSFVPPVRQRLLLMGTEIGDLVASLPPEWDSGGDAVDAEMLRRVRKVAEQLLPESRQENRPEVVMAARELLSKGQPASGVHLVPGPPITVLLSVLNERPNNSKDLLNGIFNAAVDTVCTDSEILEAAWMNELDQPPEALFGQLQAATESLEDASDGVARMAKLDTAVTGSLQAAGVHRWLVEWDDRSRAAAEALVVAAASPPWVNDPEPDPDADSLDWHEDSPLTDIQLLRRLCHTSEERRLVVRPIIDNGQIGGTTIDLRLGTEWEVLRTARFHSLNPGDSPERVRALLDASVEEFRLTTGESQDLVLHPGELLLALTLEYLRLPNDIWGNLEGRSTWARLGLQVHATAGMVDCGFEGYLTLELQNTGRLPLALSPGLRVGQMAFFPVGGIVRPYGGKETAAYSAQTKARTAFYGQHEHRALNKFLKEEHDSELIREGWTPPNIRP